MKKKMKTKNFLAACCLSFLLFLNQTIGYAKAQVLVPVGQTVGVTLDMEGVTVVDTADVESYDGKKYTPAKDAGIRPGDVIETINGTQMQSAQQLEELVNEQGETDLQVKFRRGEEEKECKVKAALSSLDGHYRIGVWIKDAASGIGTVTYFDPETKEFGALGHGITQQKEQEALPIQGGSILKAAIVSVQKGSKGQPGELIGVFAEDKEKLGSVQSNTMVGLKGVLDGTVKLNASMEPIPVAERTEVTEGAAQILSNIAEDKIEEFDIEIQKINKDEDSTKGMVIHVTDQELLEKTGGIVQGMSGSPIIQNGKLVGAVTHVFVNDPTRGYGIFMDLMLQ
ncbi:SpoIVB peptidase [Oscillospiraceae bacterium DSM 107454]|uniref:SpoIVB peptidase n=2 Tax=Ructibacterium gallinarum TaxID=2779355 RepID=A0A9D5LWX7_9FIRM|nr:SpoIVB peptidase [Ructibacterium gallinarum]